ncbi:DUF5995 family protein [Gordonia rhizosphera]|nr:DUF5995 family protein [Gordonia rhizosphera]
MPKTTIAGTTVRRAMIAVGALAMVAFTAPVAHATSGTTTCRPTLPTAERQHIADLSAPLANRTLTEARDNVHEIASIWAGQGDPRGAFADVYAPILDVTLRSIAQHAYQETPWAERLAVNFVNRYLEAVNAHVTGGEVPRAWQQHFQFATDCRHSGGRVATSGMNSHLILDLPAAIVAVHTDADQWADFNHYGEILGSATPDIIASIKEDYGTDLTELFTASIVGDAIGEQRATGLFFQSVRAAAWVSGRGLSNPVTKTATYGSMWAEWATAEAALDTSDAVGLF